MRFVWVAGWTEEGLIEARAEKKGEAPPSGLAGYKSVEEIELRVAFNLAQGPASGISRGQNCPVQG